ncbi:MAG: peptide-methionine (S)-S-oxide reductase MsrA [Candidatus Eremiobacteraeota bacterium]|nr:peptide-methionine (S)-S-oxide reductase MsrA [Candidatus Eremiobacteraeota bacterium]
MNARFFRCLLSLAAAAVLVGSAALALTIGMGATPAPAATPKGLDRIVLAGGCFWGMEGVFERVKGVSDVVAGYSGGSASTAHYELVGTETTGHAEAVEVTFDPKVISLQRLLDVYFRVAHDPTQVDGQFPDSGPSYRSEIFYANGAQRSVARSEIAMLERTHAFTKPIATTVLPLRGFYAAEVYHQHFLDRNPSNPYIVQNDLPKIAALHKTFPRLVKR